MLDGAYTHTQLQADLRGWGVRLAIPTYSQQYSNTHQRSYLHSCTHPPLTLSPFRNNRDAIAWLSQRPPKQRSVLDQCLAMGVGLFVGHIKAIKAK